MLEERPVILHKGIFKPTATTAEAVFMITGMTIGAGILVIPYAVEQVGLLIGLGFIFGLGLIVLLLNLMIGEIIVRTKAPLQLPGLAEKYLGKWARNLLSATMLFSSFGSLLVYIIGEGKTLQALFGGNGIIWSIIFWSIGSFCIVAGLQRLRVIEKVFGIIIMAIIIFISVLLLPHFSATNIFSVNLSRLFFPLGIILFALHATPAIAEAHALLPNANRRFRRAVIIGTLIPIALYALFALAVVGFTGHNTTEIATIGLGKSLGPAIMTLISIFAILAMSTGFMGLGTALREIFVWDWKMNDHGATFLVIALPLSLFLLGIRDFTASINFIGGLFISIESIIICGIYARARQLGDIAPVHYRYSRHAWLAIVPVLLFFSTLFITSTVRLFLP
jgi:amino acid permease